MKRFNTMDEEVKRIKNLFSENLLFGNLIREDDSEESESSEDEEESEVEASESSKPECCSSCNCWGDCGGTKYYNGENGKPKFTIDKSETNFTIKYEGPNSGILIKHGKCGAGDTIHQVCNVLTSEINKYLKGKGLKPNIKNITMDKSSKKFTISVPLKKSENEKSYKLERRGGMGHDPGPEPVKKEYESRGGFEGPIKHSSGNITEYFVTFY